MKALCLSSVIMTKEEGGGKWSKLMKQLKEDDEEDVDDDDGQEEDATTKADDSRTEFASHSDGFSGTLDRVSGKYCVQIGLQSLCAVF